MTHTRPKPLAARAQFRPARSLSRMLLPLAAVWSLTNPVFALDLQQAQDAALAQDARVRAARANARSEAERVPQAKAKLRPNISATFSTNRNDLDTIGPNAFGIPSSSNREYTSSNNVLSLRQPLVLYLCTFFPLLHSLCLSPSKNLQFFLFSSIFFNPVFIAEFNLSMNMFMNLFKFNLSNFVLKFEHVHELFINSVSCS